MLDDLFTQAIPLTAVLALPFPMLKAVRYLLGGRPIAHSLLFVVTWGLICFFVLTMAVILKAYLKFLLDAVSIVTTPGSSNSFPGLMHVAFGLFFLGIGVKRLRSAMEQKREPASLQSLELTPLLIIKQTIKIELFKLKNIFVLLLIINLIQKSNMGFEPALIAAGTISVTAMIWVSMPLVVYFLAGQKRKEILEKLKEWLLKNVDSLMVFIFLFIGVSTLSSGLGEMIPKLLGFLFHIVE